MEPVDLILNSNLKSFLMFYSFIFMVDAEGVELR